MQAKSRVCTEVEEIHAVQESIRQSKEWFMACAPHAMGLAAKMALHMRQLPTYEQQLHVIYLANDVLLKRCLHCLHWQAIATLPITAGLCGKLLGHGLRI